MQINIIGNVFDSSGYSVHTRSLANALNKLCEVKLTTNLVQNWQRDVNDAELEMIKRVDKGEINLIITNPIYWRVNCTAKRNFVYLVWEGDKVPKSFINECLNPEIDRIIVPSKHTFDALIKTLFEVYPEYIKDEEETGSQSRTVGGKTLWQYKDAVQWDKVVIIPHGVDHSIFCPLQIKKEDVEGKFTFLVNKGFRNLEDRGGTQYFLKSYLEEFTDKDNVRAIVKINPAYGIPDINSLISQLTDKKTDLPELVIDTNLYDYKDMPKFYQQGDVFVCPTRAEAFGIPVLEAMSCRLPTIVTDFGGQSEFAVGWKVGYELTEVQNELIYEGIKWATPNLGDLSKYMKWCYLNSKLVKEKGKQAESASKLYSWDYTAKRILDIADQQDVSLSASVNT